MLSHELRTPLNPILGWAGLLRSGKLDAAKTTHAIETIERNAKLQTQLIEDLLDVSRILQGKLELNIMPVNLVLTVQSALETVQLAAEAKGIELRIALEEISGKTTENSSSVNDPPRLMVSGDSVRLQQIIWNLLTNAIKFSNTGDRVAIRLSYSDRHAQIQVIDTGKGIHPDFCLMCLNIFGKPIPPRLANLVGWGWGWRSSVIWWNCIAEPCKRTVWGRTRCYIYRPATAIRK